jgi:NAD(P)-dependent dehydrogenase (short-subunit alcohol dehydrogenase family)
MAYEKLSLHGRVAVVVGGTTGIGRAISLGLTQAGAAVVASSRRREQVDAVSKEIEDLGGRTLRVTSDVTNRASLERLLATTLESFDQVDILVNCAGRTQRGATLDVSEEDWSAIIECNLTGTLRGCQTFGRHMIQRGYGRIVNVASLTTYVAFQEVAAYGASKAAVGALTKSLAVEWGRHGVCVNAIAPVSFARTSTRRCSTAPIAVGSCCCVPQWVALATWASWWARPSFSARRRRASSTERSSRWMVDFWQAG